MRIQEITEKEKRRCAERNAPEEERSRGRVETMPVARVTAEGNCDEDGREDKEGTLEKARGHASTLSGNGEGATCSAR